MLQSLIKKRILLHYNMKNGCNTLSNIIIIIIIKYYIIYNIKKS